MPIKIDRMVGPYKILAPLGAGGMGEVYRARDTRLNREVAIKCLPASLAQDTQRLRRFKQEALATSALNHPNIVTVYDIVTHDGALFIVTELLKGEELRAHLNGGPLPVRQVVEYAQQIAIGLAAAHEKGIVHRDLKPENLFVTESGHVKILDFGLAKFSPQRSDGLDTGATTQEPLTDPGVVMGTVSYMAPEQVRGQPSDHRADIFSFGVILYEMLSGKRPFNGSSVADVMSAILKEEPPELGETNPKIPPAMEKIVRRCLGKKPERRFQTASDLEFAIEALATPSNSLPEPLGLETVKATPIHFSRKKRWVAAAAVAALVMLAVALAWAYFTRQQTPDVRLMKFSILPPDKSSFDQIAVSPDGRHLAFTAATGGKVQLWVRALDDVEAKALNGTQGASSPFWSPDSRFVSFFADDNRLKKVEFTGGPVQTICEVTGNVVCGTWSRSGEILLARAGGTGLLRISPTGVELTQVTNIDKSRGELQHRSPTFLPDGRHFLYSIYSGQKETRGIYLGSLDEPIKRRLLDDVSTITYTAAAGDTAGDAGWLLFEHDGALLARPFNTRRFEFTGEPFSLSDTVGGDLRYISHFTFSVSKNGVLVFDPSTKRRRRQYLWLDRRGQQINSLNGEVGLAQHYLSPDDRRFIADRFDPVSSTPSLWLYDVFGGVATRFTFDTANDRSPVWAPDGSRIVWASNRGGEVANLFEQAANGAGKESLLLQSAYSKFPTDWSRDGRFIIYRESDPKTKSDLWVLPVQGGGDAKPFLALRTEANETAGTLSPDGRWLAYASDVSGRYEVYVQSFPDGNGKRQISSGGGNHPRWRRDGRELFYYAADGKLMASTTKSAESLEVGAAVSLFEFRAGTAPGFSPYAVAADGQRFLINAVVERESNAPLAIVVNWAPTVKK